MTIIEKQVQRARSRLLLNIWFETMARTLAWVTVGYAVAVLLFRAMGWSFPWLLVACATAGSALVVSVVWSYCRRPDERAAAAALDEAAGLRERVSTSLYCDGVEDAFAAAVCADAQDRVSSLTVNQHLRLRLPRQAFNAGAAVLVAALMFLVPNGLLAKAEGKGAAGDEAQLTKTQVAIRKQLSEVKQMAKTNPALADLDQELEKLDMLPAEKMRQPADVRQEAIKKIDKLADAVRKKQSDNKYDKVSDTKKMLRALKQPQGQQQSLSDKLTRNLANGDFKSARETIKEMQEQLATLKHDSDKELVKQMQKQLDDLAKKLDTLAEQKQMQKKLEQAGIDKEQAKRMLERLNKEDINQIKKKLQEQGMSQKQIEQMTQQCQRQQCASQSCQKMSQAMSKAAQSMGAGQMGQAVEAMQQAGDEMSELEMLEQEMNQLDSSLSALQDAKNQMNQPCSQCNGTGEKDGGKCPGCQGSGQQGGNGQGQQGGGMGNRGRGQGSLAQSEETPIDFKIERGKVEVTKGRIVGQFLVDGEQIKGEANDDFVEMISAAERTATDTVNRDRIPRQYQKAVKDYFSRLPKEFGAKVSSDGDGDSSAEETSPAESEASGTDSH